MKPLAFYLSLSLLLCSIALGQTGAVVTTANAASVPSQDQGARIAFENTRLDFGTVDAGTLVRHEYYFTNTGGQLLEITNVRASCGCTTATNWDRTVEPGGVGKITAQFDSRGFLGGVTKSVIVSCNDASQTNVVLWLVGSVFQPIEFSPSYLAFNPGPDSVTNEVRVTRIVNKTESPITLDEPVCTNKSFRAELRTVHEGKEFELTVTALAPFTNSYAWAPVTMKTSCARSPLLTANCYLRILPALVINPTQITLSTTPLAQPVTNVVTIRNNTTNALVLSNPQVSVEGVGLELKELQAGHEYSLTLTFPAGFHGDLGKAMEARVSSNDPKNPVLRVSIMQIAVAPGTSPPVRATGDQHASTSSQTPNLATRSR